MAASCSHLTFLGKNSEKKGSNILSFKCFESFFSITIKLMVSLISTCVNTWVHSVTCESWCCLLFFSTFYVCFFFLFWSLLVSYDRLIDCFGLEVTLITQFQPAYHGQGHLPPDQVAQSPVQPGLERGGSHSFSGQPGPGPHHPHK